MGLGGGESTNSLDPALDLSQVPFMYMSTMGNLLTAVSPTGDLIASLAESWDSSPDAKTWTFKIRKGVEFHNGQTMTADDVLKTLQRHSDKNSKSGALRHHAGHRHDEGGWRRRGHRPEVAECGPALSDGGLPPDHPARRRHGQARRRHFHRRLQAEELRARRAHRDGEVRELLGRFGGLSSTRSRCSSSTTRRHATRRCSPARCRWSTRSSRKSPTC